MKKFTTENAESTENLNVFLCVLCALCGEIFGAKTFKSVSWCAFPIVRLFGGLRRFFNLILLSLHPIT